MVLHDNTERVRVERLRKDFVANVSHELKTPLAGLSLLGGTMARALDDDLETARDFAARLEEEVRRLTVLVDDLLDLSFQTRAHERGIELEIDALVPAPVRGDQVALSTLVRNLVDNALRYTEPGGRVAVTTTILDGRVSVTVEDDGIGIPRDDRERIFERFYRVDKARSRRTGGTGLGLSIVRNVAQLHGGTVKVESAVGVGSTFTVEFPAAGTAC